MEYQIHPRALVGANARIGAHTRIWAFVNVTDGAVIGDNCNICDCCFIEKGAVIGNNVTIKNNVAVFNGITLEDDVFCGPGVAFTNDRFPRGNRADPWTLSKTLVCRGATIGANATILCGITIGRYALVGAGSVVTADVPAHAMAVGTPARTVGYVCRCGEKLGGAFACSCGLRYRNGPAGLEPDE